MNLSLQDMLVMWASVLGPIVTLIGFMWHHFNNLGHDLRRELNSLRGDLNGELKALRGELNGVEKRLDEKISSVERGLGEKLGEKIDAARDRISRIEGQLAPAKIIAFEEVRPKEITEQRSAIKHS
jgi:hypothetical protein